MRFSSPIFILKRKAKRLAKDNGMPHHAALDQIAIAEGFRSWGHLASSAPVRHPAKRVLNGLCPGDMLLLGARPGHGKTLLGLELAALAQQGRRDSYFFTLDYNVTDVLHRFAAIGLDAGELADTMIVDTSDDICARYIIDHQGNNPGNAFIVIDYLQLLDQKRSNPALCDQISLLGAHAKATGCIIVIISQIDRAFEHKGKDMPDSSDIRLPNPVDIALFDKTCFLHEGQIGFSAAA